ncbi:hypothetical protein BSZ39_12820 [Bowdeniella nasicola]|uniref:Solute-binding protein family 5 domain-containing protein n=1 Tax=Bowdeniella nasicola TaxID=208480 RepID=A0A1Q5PUU6_9ACTO|nr:hypothetical protein BSZ39_12820 [Bowdeniella nasicola]
MTYDADIKVVGDLAKDWQVSEDALTWTFTLNNGIKFSDGTPVTAKDVVFTYQMLKDDGEAFDLSFVTQMDAPDEHTVKFTLDAPRSTFISQLTEVPIVPAASYGPDYSKNPIGSGPYKVAQYTKDEQLILEANEHYATKPTFKKLTFLLQEEDAALAAARAGKVDVAYAPSSLADQKIDGMTAQAYKSVDVRGIAMPSQPAGNTGKLKGEEVEVGNDVTSDLAIRQALSVGLNRQKLVDIALGGFGKPAFSSAEGLPFDGGISFKDGDTDRAKTILAEAGWTDSDGDGIVEKDGKPASFTGSSELSVG